MLGVEDPGPSDEEVKCCLEGGRQEARGQVGWGHPSVEVRRKKFYG